MAPTDTAEAPSTLADLDVRDRVANGSDEGRARESAELNRRYLRLLGNLPGMVYRCRNDEHWTMEFVSPGVDELTGYQPQDLIGNGLVAYADLIHPDDREDVWAQVQQAVTSHRPFTLEYRLVTKDGAIRRAWERGCTVIDEQGALVALEGVVFDDTEFYEQRTRRRLEEARSARQRDTLISLAMVGPPRSHDELMSAMRRITEAHARAIDVDRASIWQYTEDRDAIVCLDLFEARTGTHSSGTRLDAVDFPAYFRAIAESDVVAADNAHTDSRTTEFSVGYMTPLGITSMMDAAIRIGGRVEGVLCSEHVGPPRQWTGDESTFSVAIANLVALAFEGQQRQQAESLARLQAAALEATASSVVITDRAGTIEWVNPSFCATSGYEADEAIGRNPRELVRSGVHDGAFYKDLWDTILSGRVWRGELTNRRKDGTLCSETMTITPVLDPASGDLRHFVAVREDITEQKRLQAQFLQMQRMEVVGRLAGGIAHDFNNLLTVINGTADLALSELSTESAALARDLRNILDAGGRAAGLTQQLLAFSRRQVLKRDVVRLDALVGGLSQLLQRLLGEPVRLEIESDPDLGVVLADSGQLGQVVMNLAINARDAMPDGGTLTIETRNVDLDESFASSHVSVSPGPHVLLSVTDTGVGMDESVRERLFEPFFTTKGVGKGTGLGLATVYGIVKQSGGTIWVASRPGHGSCFSVYLPRHLGPPAATPQEAVPASQAATERILVVEDEQALRELTVRVLKLAGYGVAGAASGQEAMEILSQEAGEFDLLLTDVVLPGINGRELATEAVARHPGMKVLFTSGYTDDAILRHGVLDNQAHFIAKPYPLTALRRKIRELLDTD